MTLAKMYPVATQADLVDGRRRALPPMVLSATLTIVVSMIAMISPSITVMVIRPTGACSRWRKGFCTSSIGQPIGGRQGCGRDGAQNARMFPAFRSLVASAVVAAVFAAPAAASPKAFDAAMNAVFARPVFAHAIVAAEIYDLDARRPIYARNPQTLMEAASTTKLLTTGTALALLGSGFRWITPVYRTGPVDAAGVLHGDVVLVARGDPNLSQRIRPDGSLAFENEDHSYDGSYDTRAVPGDPLAVLRDLASQIARAGVRQIDGRVVVDAGLFADQGPEDGTGAIVSPIVVNDNLVDVTVTPGVRPGDPVTLSVSPQTAYVKFVTRATTAAAKSEPSIDFSGDKTNLGRLAYGHDRGRAAGGPPDALFLSRSRTAAFRAGRLHPNAARCRGDREFAAASRRPGV